MYKRQTAGYATIDAGEYPLLAMTRRGAEVMKGETPPHLLLPELRPKAGASRVPSSGGAKAEVPLPEADLPLFEALRTRRKELADEKGVPAYVVCSNRTLTEIAMAKPTDRNSLLTVRGMGPARVEAWGEALLHVVLEAS